MSDIELSQSLNDIEYGVQTMAHQAIVQIEPTKLELLEGFEKISAGFKFSPQDTKARLIIAGKDWSRKSVMVYGSTSNDEAEAFLDEFLNRIQNIGHTGAVISGPRIVNIAVGGDFHRTLDLTQLSTVLKKDSYNIEYEPEQFPAAILKLENPSVSFLLFSTGKFTIQGLDDYEDIEPAISRVLTLFEEV